MIAYLSEEDGVRRRRGLPGAQRKSTPQERVQRRTAQRSSQ